MSDFNLEIDNEIQHLQQETGQNTITLPAYALYRRGETGLLTLLSTDLRHKQFERHLSHLMSSHWSRLKSLQSSKPASLTSDCGSVLSIDLTDLQIDESPLCYFCHVDVCSAAEIDEAATRPSDMLILCLLAAASSHLDLYLHRFSVALLADQTIPLDLEDDEALRRHLAGWYPQCTSHLVRCVKRLSADVKYLLFAALTNTGVEVTCSDAQLHDDIVRFVAHCSLRELVNSQLTGAESGDRAGQLAGQEVGHGVTSRPRLQLRVDTDSHQFSSHESSVFCDEWSSRLVSAVTSGQPDSVGCLYSTIDHYKLRMIHDLNTFKRMLLPAETDYYELYRCLQFLHDSDNSQVIVSATRLESQRPETVAVTDVLQRFIGRASSHGGPSEA